MRDKLADNDLRRFSEFVARAMGLDFPCERWGDLRRGIEATTGCLGFEDAAACARWFVSGLANQKQREVLASHLTVGETYFFRDRRSFEILGGQIVPELLRGRLKGGRRLRFWSAACCSGEEAYSIAIVLRQVVPIWMSARSQFWRRTSIRGS